MGCFLSTAAFFNCDSVTSIAVNFVEALEHQVRKTSLLMPDTVLVNVFKLKVVMTLFMIFGLGCDDVVGSD